MSANETKLKSKSGSIRAYSTLVYIVVIFFAILAIFPFWFMFMNATWDTHAISQSLKLYPNPNAFSQLAENWNNLRSRSTFSFAIGFKNSFIISTSATALTVYFSAMTAYGLSAYEFKGRKTIYAIIVGIMMVPTAVTITGFYRLMSAMHLIGTLWPLILPAIAAPATVFFIKQYLETSLSKEIIEASRIDGAGEFFTFNRICLPIMTPALATQGIFAFISSWNNFFAPSILLTSTKLKTLPLMVSLLYSDRFVDYGMIYTGLSVSVIPIIIVYCVLQRYIIQGVSAGGVKE